VFAVQVLNEEEVHVTTEETNQLSSIEDLEPKMSIQGVVKEIGLHGAVVDLGLEYEGVLHVSQLSSDDNIGCVSEVIQPGDKVTVWVSDVDPKQQRISLTMIKPADVTWSELSEGQIHSGTVTRIESYGAFVDIGAERAGLLHVREMSQGYVEHPSEMVSVGDEIEVRVLQFDQRRRRIDLSMIGLEEEVTKEPEEHAEEEEETSQTTMEMALERAYADQQKGEEPEGAQHEKKREDYSRQQDIASRTLKEHKDSE
jgi:ribosomal protein S1